MTEEEKRDEVLETLERFRRNAIFAARKIAFDIEARNGRVTSTEVLRIMKAKHGPMIEGIDHRFMGAVFRRGQGWKRLGWETTGSHGRPVAIWGR